MRTLTLSTLSLLFLLALGTPPPASAQFQGKVLFDSYEVKEGERTGSDTFTLYITPDRILLQGENSYSGMGPLEAEGVLVRLDFEDFVFLTGDDRALTISKADITSFMQMFEEGNGRQSAEQAEPEVNYEKTGETRQINGYTCERFVVRDRDRADRRTDVWMTAGLDINWGMLAEPWSGSSAMIGEGDFPLSAIFREGYFPVLIENYEGDTLTSLTELREIDRSGIARAMVQIPSGVKVLSFQDYLFQRMRDN